MILLASKGPSTWRIGFQIGSRIIRTGLTWLTTILDHHNHVPDHRRPSGRGSLIAFATELSRRSSVGLVANPCWGSRHGTGHKSGGTGSLANGIAPNCSDRVCDQTDGCLRPSQRVCYQEHELLTEPTAVCTGSVNLRPGCSQHDVGPCRDTSGYNRTLLGRASVGRPLVAMCRGLKGIQQQSTHKDVRQKHIQKFTKLKKEGLIR